MFLWDFVRDSLIVFFSWILLGISFYSWGYYFADLIKIKISGDRGHIANVWLGWFFCLFFFSIYHLFFPIDVWGSCIFYLTGLILFIAKFANRLRKYLPKIKTAKLLLLVVIGLLASTFAVQMPYGHYDTGLYHLNTISWANEYPIIKGIGNLHTRLGFNQFFFLYAASLNFHPFFNDYGFHISNSFLYVLFVSTCVWFGTSVDLILLCMFYFIPLNSIQSNASMLAVATPDLAASILQIIVFRYSLEAFWCKEKDKDIGDLILFYILLDAFIVTIKLSGMPFVLGVILMTLLYNRKRLMILLNIDSMKRCLIFVFIFFFVYVARGYLQTGYPFFPSTAGDIGCDWKVPSANAEYIRNLVYTGSKSDGRILIVNHPQLKDFKWLKFWINLHVYRESFMSSLIKESPFVIALFIAFPMLMPTKTTGIFVAFLISLAAFLIWLISVFLKKGLYSKSYFIFYWIVILLGSITFWGIVAPEPRFSNSVFILFFVCCIWLLSVCFNLRMNVHLKRILKIYPIIVLLLCFVQDYYSGIYRINGVTGFAKPTLQKMTSNLGVNVLVPVSSLKTWNSGLMCSPEFNTELGLRTGDIKDGFYIRNHELNKLILKPVRDWLYK